MTGIRPYCTFEVNRLLLGVDVSEVQEVIRHREPTRVPTAPPAILGLINLRGQIVTLLDLRVRLGLDQRTDRSLSDRMNVVVHAPGGPVGLVVDEIGDVLEVDLGRIERTPETVPTALRRLTSGLYPRSGRPMLVLEIARMIEEEDSDDR